MTPLLPVIQLTYAQRMAYDTSTLLIGQCFYQTDDGATDLRGYYFWSGSWVYAGTQLGSQTVLDGRGPNLYATAGLFIRNLDNLPNGGFLVVSFASGNDALFGLFDGAFVGLEISPAGETALTTRLNQTLGLWSRTADNLVARMLDLKFDVGSSNKVVVARYYGNGLNFGEVPVTANINLSEFSNVGAAPTPNTVWILPASTLLSNNQVVELNLSGPTAGNANAKRARLLIDSVPIADTTSIAANNKPWHIRARLYRVSATQYKYLGEAGFSGSAPQLLEGTAALSAGQDWTSAFPFTVELTGASSNDITVKEFEAEVRN